MARNILVVGELDAGAVSSTTAELIGQATRLADGGQVSVTLLGSGAAGAAAAAFEAGADRAFTGDDAGYDDYNSDSWVSAVENAVGQASAEAVFIAQSVVGRDMGPRIAARLGSAVAMDCVDVTDDGGALKATRPCYGGNARATYGFATSPAVATIRAKAFDPIAPRAGASGETVDLGAPAASRTTIVGRELAEASGLQITDAPIVVSGGRGLGGPEGFEVVEALAAAFGTNRAAVGASRAACDRVVPGQPAGGPHRQGGDPGSLRRDCHLRRQSAHGGLLRIEDDYRGEPGPGRQHLLRGEVRNCRRLQAGGPGADRSAQGRQLADGPPRIERARAGGSTRPFRSRGKSVRSWVDPPT